MKIDETLINEFNFDKNIFTPFFKEAIIYLKNNLEKIK